ncbi:MAG: BspA family leucine-rich repeat surface protein [Erysipelotrichaceae bacterium]|nr:BspA family leucine-rich repeat surface protein [Erysipelotrichaceae bacterium]
MKYKKVIKIIMSLALATSIITNSVGNMFAQQEQQVEETISEEYENEVKDKIEGEIAVAEEKEELSDADIPLVEEKAVNQENRAARYTLSREKFQDIHLRSGYIVNSIEFIDGPLPEGATSTDLSENGDGSVIAANVNGRLIVTTNTPGAKVIFPWDSSFLFANLISDNLIGADVWTLYRNSIELKNVDTSNVATMRGMFAGILNLKSLDLRSFNTKKVKNMSMMFGLSNDLTDIDFSSFDTRELQTTAYMFADCNSLKNLDLSNFNTPNLKNAYGMFFYASSLQSVDLSNFNTTNVYDMEYMFYNCRSLKELDLRTFNTSNVTTMQVMFADCSSLTTIYADEWDTAKVTKGSGVFSGCNKIAGKSEYGVVTPFDSTRTSKNMATPNGGYFTVPDLEEWNATVKYIDEDNQVIGDQSFIATNKQPLITVEKINEFMPNGYESVNEIVPFTVTEDNQIFEVVVRKIQWTLELEYQTADGTVIKEEVIQVTQLNPVVTAQTIIEKVPTGYELIDSATDWTATANGEKKVVQVREVEWIINLEYQIADGTVIKEEQIQVTQLNPVITAQTITEKVPTGYELVDPASDWAATANGEKKIIQVRAIEWTVSLEYQTADGTVIKEEQIQVTQLNPVVTAQMITDGMPTSYELVDPATDWTATANGDKKVIQVREIEWTIMVEFVTENSRGIVETVTFTVGNLNPVIEAQQIMDAIPAGYYAINEIQDLIATKDGEVFQVVVVKIEDWEGIVHFVDQNGVTVKTEVYSVTNKDPMIRVEEIEKALPIGATLVNPLTELTVTKNKEEFIIEVIMPIDPTQSEDNIESVQTGDATQIGLWTILMGGSIGILAYLKRKKKNI